MPPLAWSTVLPIAAVVAVAQLVAAAVGSGYWFDEVYMLWLCTGGREPWAAFWPQLRHLTVS